MTRPISHRRLPSTEPEGKEGGYTLALTALLLVPLMLIAALAVDVGSWYVEAQEVQRAADAAALAGVTFMPDFYDDAVAKARETAAKNGYTHGTNGVTVDAVPVPGNRRRLKVTITDPNVRTYFGIVSKDKITVARAATAEYVLPVPLGSPRNYLGTGNLGIDTATFDPEYLWASENGYCTGKEQGDQKASFYVKSPSCSGALNSDYSDVNYSYTIELPTTRTYNTDVIIFDGNYRDGSGSASDNNPSSNGSQTQPPMSTTFTLHQVDPTPLDDTDNPTMLSLNACSSAGTGHEGTKTFDPGISESGYTFNPDPSKFTSRSWWQLCRIPNSAPGGRYILEVSNQDKTGALDLTRGSNNFGIAATPSSPQRLCDARTDTTCPKVYANQSLSVRAAATSSTANFFLSDIGPEHKGKKVVITLWDPAEGGQTIRIRKPTGSNTWVDQTFDWTATNNDPAVNGTSGTGVTAIAGLNPVTMNFTGELITISFTLPTTYAPPTDNEWWQIAYTFGSTDVTDRTTWSVSIVGDPVHLVG